MGHKTMYLLLKLCMFVSTATTTVDAFQFQFQSNRQQQLHYHSSTGTGTFSISNNERHVIVITNRLSSYSRIRDNSNKNNYRMNMNLNDENELEHKIMSSTCSSSTTSYNSNLFRCRFPTAIPVTSTSTSTAVSSETRKVTNHKMLHFIQSIQQHMQELYYLTILKMNSSMRKTVSSTMLALSLFFISVFGCVPGQSANAAAAASTGGRMGGGSFSRSSSSSYSRSYSRPSTTSNHYQQQKRSPQYYSPSKRIVLLPSHGILQQQQQNYFVGTNPLRSASTAMIVKDTMLLVGTGALVTYGIANNAYRNNNNNIDNDNNEYGTAAGGATIASITISFTIPNKNDPNTILNRLKYMSTTANTISNRGLKDLVTAVTIELTRQKDSIDSASTFGQYYRTIGQAEREFRILSVKEQSKVDRLTVNKFQGENKPDIYNMQQRTIDGSFGTESTKAVVTINVAMGGNFIKQDKTRNNNNNSIKISNRYDLINVLTQIGSDVQLENNQMIAAEIFWSPEQIDDILTQDEVYYKYPELLPL